MEECYSEDQEMEIVALQSIYGKLFTSWQQGDQSGNRFHYEVKFEEREIKIEFTIPENYPEISPAISVMTLDNKPAHTGLESLLYAKAHESRGQLMIYDLIEEANCWLDKLNFVKEVSLEKENASSSPSAVCSFFLDDKFKTRSLKKDKPINSSNNSQNFMPTFDKQLSNENMKPADSTKGKLNTEKRNTAISKKKPPMKTVRDVISRIKWDEELSAEDFTVGYLDRFLGIMEKGFADFSWDDLASVDHFIDFAIPQHRIQYFKYLDEIVWDKRERIDKVFGSTGSKETILDVKSRICKSREENSDNCIDSHKMPEIPAELPMQGLERNGPNYFIGVQISDIKVIDNIRKIQNDIYSELSSEADVEIIPSQRLHITLLMLTLHDDDEVITAKTIMKSVQPLLISLLPLSHTLCFSGLGQFHNKILYAGIKPDAELSKLVQVLKYKFGKAGVNLEGNRKTFVPHVTITKMASKNLDTDESVSRKVSDLVNTCYEIGEQCVSSLTLFSRFAPKDLDGTHHKIAIIENSLKALSFSLPAKLLQQVHNLSEQGQLGDDVRSELKGLFESGDAVKLDQGFKKLTELSNVCDDKILLIMRGIPGSSTSYLVENSVEAINQKGYVYCNARQLFHKSGCSFVPDVADLAIAEAYCLSCVLDAMATEKSFIVVDGVHSQCWEYAVYKFLALAFGFKCHVLEIKVSKHEDVMSCLQNSKSGAQLEEILEIVQNWENDPGAAVIGPSFHNHETSENLKLTTVSLKELFLRN